MQQERILVVEDEPDIARLIGLHLQDLGFAVELVSTGSAALQYAANRRLALVVLDLGLPDGDGLDVCRQLRERHDYTPVLILTARSSETDRVVGLELGADDYLVKPFAIRELMARVKAIRRRVALSRERLGPAAERLEIDGLTIEPAKRRVTVNGAERELTATEFDLLVQLATHPGRVYSRAQLLDLVWGHDSGAGEHAVNAHVNRLRAKVEPDPARPHYVRTVWGVGYSFHDPRAEA